MLILTTGAPGASKTLNTMNRLISDSQFLYNPEDKDLPKEQRRKRPVFYYNIPQVSEDLGWSEMTAEQAQEWYKLPAGAVIVMDECQSIFPTTSPSAKPQPHVSELCTHRHRGYDIFLITQDPTLIDSKVRKLVGMHYHYMRRAGAPLATEFRWDRCANDPTRSSEQSLANISQKPFPKKCYGLYKSADLHTQRVRIPKKIWLAGLFFLVGGIGAYMMIDLVTGYSDRGQAAAPEEITQGEQVTQYSSMPSGLNASGSKNKVMTKEEYAEHWTPRFKAIPHSAPAYDALALEVKSFPRPQCMQWTKTQKCSCFTQQATPLDVPDSTCRAIVKNGYFDPTKADSRSSQASSRESRKNTVMLSSSDTPPVVSATMLSRGEVFYDREH